MTHSSVTRKCTYFPHLGPVRCLPAPNIFPLAKETFAKGKMFWNSRVGVVTAAGDVGSVKAAGCVGAVKAPGNGEGAVKSAG